MEFTNVTTALLRGVAKWETRLMNLKDTSLFEKQNDQNRTIKQILGHMVDSASNNLHRIIHLQYEKNPLTFPNYAINGNNDRWIAIQNYQDENWGNLVQLWKYINIHLVHTINNVDPVRLKNEWISGTEYGNISLEEMITDYLRHFHLHLDEIQVIIIRAER